eukprot:scaffold2415_cov73-Skeletonema_menzelii.AAC.4
MALYTNAIGALCGIKKSQPPGSSAMLLASNALLQRQHHTTTLVAIHSFCGNTTPQPRCTITRRGNLFQQRSSKSTLLLIAATPPSEKFTPR